MQHLKLTSMINIEELKNEDIARAYLMQVIDKNIRHEDYNRVTELADTYYAMITGDGLDEMLKRIVTRESEEMFKQRKDITKHITPSILSPTKLPYYKASRKQAIVRLIDYETANEDNVNTINQSIKSYWGGKSLEEFLEWAYVDYVYMDPNAFIVTDFNEFDPKESKAKPYPSIIDSHQAIDYKIINEELKYLVTKLDITYIDAGEDKEGFQYTLWLDDYQYQFSQVAERYLNDKGEKPTVINGYFYTFKVFEPKTGKITAHRIGFIKDYCTQGRTCVSVFHCALGILEKTLKINSEMDLSTAMVAFPQRFSYVQPCNNCNKGNLTDGSTCPECNGTGVRKHHGSVMDIIELPMPAAKEDMIPLSEMLYYNNPPIDLIKFQNDYCDKLKRTVFSTMFNAEIFSRNEVVATATEKNIEVDNMNDTLFPFLRKYSQLWMEIVEDIAVITELNNGLILEHKFPFDLKFKNIYDLMADLKIAKDSGASSATIAAIEDDINEILYADRPEELKEIRIKNQFNPFRGFSQERLMMAIGTGYTTKYNEVLYLNIENIFQQLEKEQIEPWIYDLGLVKIEGLVRVKVEEIIKSLDKEKTEAFSFGNPDSVPLTDDQGNPIG